ncbi:MAG: RDD family protein [Verrucomicrobiales bacterium]
MERLDTLQRVELTEGVAIRLRTAGPMVRFLAVAIDVIIQFGSLIGIVILFGMLSAIVGINIGTGLILLALFTVFWFYFIFFEAGKHNATPGKRCFGLRVARTSGAPPTMSQIVIRNFLRLVDFMPFVYFQAIEGGWRIGLPSYAFGLVACAFTRNFQRLGDLAANTVVLYNDRNPAVRPVRLDIEPMAPPVSLTREEQLSITDFVERITEWSDERRREMADILEPLTGATGEEGVRRLLGIGLWIRNDSEGGAEQL